ncbi:MAG TPA: phosphate/phosphite/phosphonate ABC transporter substrate-binding protein [bacterium]|nr:phosphate/phosphite/phosphonate ABC transporter substrate-binding protein [bacterium]
MSLSRAFISEGPRIAISGRRKILSVLLILICGFIAALGVRPLEAETGPAGNGGKPAYDRSGWPERLVIAYPSIGSKEKTLKRYESLHRFLSGYLEVKVEPVVTDGYEPIYIGFQLGSMDLAYLGAMSYIELSEVAPAEPVVMELAPDGRAGYRAVIIARVASGMKTLPDARGKKLALVDVHSTSGFLIPCLHFLEDLNATPAAFAKTVEFTHSHDALILDVAGGKYDFGATNDLDLDRVCAERGLKSDQFVVLWRSQAYPTSPFAARKGLAPGFRAALKDAMLAAGQEQKVQADIGIGGFGPVRDSDYDKVRALRALMN